MKSSQLAKTQKPFTKLKGRIEIDETFIKEIHKGNFKNPDDPRKKWIEENAKDLNCCIEMAIDENKNIYAQTTNTKRLTKKCFNFQKNSWWNKKNHQPGLKFDFI